MGSYKATVTPLFLQDEIFPQKLRGETVASRCLKTTKGMYVYIRVLVQKAGHRASARSLAEQREQLDLLNVTTHSLFLQRNSITSFPHLADGFIPESRKYRGPRGRTTY